MKLQEIALSNSQNAVLVTAVNNNKLAVVDLLVLQRLADLLPKANLGEIKELLCNQLHNVVSIEQYVDLLKNEVSFHETVNLITTIEEGIYYS